MGRVVRKVLLFLMAFIELLIAIYFIYKMNITNYYPLKVKLFVIFTLTVMILTFNAFKKE